MKARRSAGLRLSEVCSTFPHSNGGLLFASWPIPDYCLEIFPSSLLQQVKGLRTVLAEVSWFWVVFAFLTIPTPPSIYLFLCLACLVSPRFLPGAASGSNLWTQMQASFGFFMSLYLLFLNPWHRCYLGKGQRTIFFPPFITRDTNTSPDIKISKVPIEQIRSLATEVTSELRLKQRGEPPAFAE